MERVKMLVVMQAVFTEQACYDGGGLRIAHLLTGLDDPPFSQTELHRTANPLYAHGQLADPRWVAANLAYLKDLEGSSEKSGKYVRPQGKGSETAQGDETSKKTGKPKKKGGKKGSSEVTPSPSLPADCDEARELLVEDSCSAKAPLPDFISSLDFGADLIKITFQ